MKTLQRILTTAALLGLFLTPCGADGDQAAEIYKVQKDQQPLFKKPTPSLGILGRLALGTELTVVRTKGSWKQVKGKQLAGWIQGPRKSVLGGKAVSSEYLKSKATAGIDAGLVTKGFSNAYARANGVTREQQEATKQQLESPHFDFEAYEQFLQAGKLSLSEAPEEPEVQQVPAAKPRNAPSLRDRLGKNSLADTLRNKGQLIKLRKAISEDPHYFAKNLSYAEEERLGYGVAQRLAAGKIHPSELLNTYVNLIGAVLVEHSDRPDIPYVFTVLDSGDINAFAAPGGYIFITTGCLAACKNEAELAAVLGHEVAHVARRHSARGLDDHRLNIVKAMARANMDESLEEVYGPMDPKQAEIVRKLRSLADDQYKSCTASWGQKFELEADEFGMRYAARAGWDYSGLTEFLKVLLNREEPNLGPGWDSHPPAKQRIENLRQIVESEAWSHSGNFQESRFKEYTKEIR